MYIYIYIYIYICTYKRFYQKDKGNENGITYLKC